MNRYISFIFISPFSVGFSRGIFQEEVALLFLPPFSVGEGGRSQQLRERIYSPQE